MRYIFIALMLLMPIVAQAAVDDVNKESIVFQGLHTTTGDNDIERVKSYFRGGIESSFASEDDRGHKGYGHLYYYPGHIKFKYDEPEGMILVGEDDKIVIKNSKKNTMHSVPVTTHPLGILVNINRDNIVFEHVMPGKNSLVVDIRDGTYSDQGVIRITFADLGGELKLYDMKLMTDEHNWTSIDFNGCHGVSISDIIKVFG